MKFFNTQNNLIKMAIGVVIIVIFLFIALFYFQANESEELPNTDSSSPIDADSFNMQYTYLGNNNWNYTITGTLPNPCYQVNKEVIVQESFPETVVVQLEVSSQDDICIQVIEEYVDSGVVQASSSAEFDLVVL